MDLDWKEMDLEELLAQGRDQTGNLTFYKLVFNALDQLAADNASTPEVYHRSLRALAGGFLASVRPEYLPQAVAAKNLLVKKIPF